MKCQDVRRTLSLFVDGQLALTEWAIIQGHVLECAECRKELDRLRGLAGVRARASRRRATAMTAAAMALVLAVAALGGFFIYQGSFPDLPSWWPAPRAVIPTVPAPESVRPAPVPAPVVRPAPPLEQPAPPSPTGTTGIAEVTPRSTTPPAPPPPAPRPAASVEAPPQDRMPTTQARPPVVVNAPPDAEAMPTQSPSGLARRRR
jgi:hypothetical protein